MRWFILTWMITSWSTLAIAVPPDADPIRVRFQQDVENLPELRNSLAVIEESRDWRQRAIALYEAGHAAEASHVMGWATWHPPRVSRDGENEQLDAAAMDRLQVQVKLLKELNEYHQQMTRALDLHDGGDVKEAHRISSEAALRFPDQPGAKWFANHTVGGQQIPPGASIEFINRSDVVIPSVDFHYARSSSVLGFSHVHHIVRNLSPGHTQSIYTDELPKGCIRLYVEFQIDINGEAMHFMTSASMISRRMFGFVPTVIIEKDGSVSFSRVTSAEWAERAKANPRPSLMEQLESLQGKESQGTGGQ